MTFLWDLLLLLQPLQGRSTTAACPAAAAPGYKALTPAGSGKWTSTFAAFYSEAIP
jgi:hypothetical protein